MPDDPYTLADLARLADVTPRTVRYYVAQGLLPSPEAAGPSTRYGEGHLARLRLIRRLQRDHLPLAEIRLRLERLGDDEVVAAVATLDAVEPEPSRDPDDTLGFVRALMVRSGVRPTTEPGLRGPAAPAPARAAFPLRMEVGPPPAAEQVPTSAIPLADAWEAPAAAGSALGPPPSAPAAPSMPAPSTPMPAPPAPSASTLARPAHDRSTWERLVIAPDVELHIRRPLDRATNKRVDQLERIARELFEDA